MANVLYRYERETYSVIDDEGFIDKKMEPKILLNTYRILRETKSYYIIYIKYNVEKRVSKTAKNTFAYDTKEKALANYKARCWRALCHTSFNKRLAKIFYKQSKTIENPDQILNTYG